MTPLSDYVSKEELQYSFYLDELVEAGFVEEYLYEPVSIPLSDPIGRLRKHSYTPDFVVVWNKKAEGLFYGPYLASKPSYLPTGQVLPDNNIVSYIEIKGARDFKNMERLAKINIKWAHQKFSLQINMVKPLHEKVCLHELSHLERPLKMLSLEVSVKACFKI